MLMSANNVEFIEKFFTEEYEYWIWSGTKSVGTDFTDLVADTMPSDREGLVYEIATDNSLDGAIDVKVEGKSQLKEPLECKGFPANMQGLKLMLKIPKGKKFSIQARGLSGSITIPYRVVILLKKV